MLRIVWLSGVGEHASHAAPDPTRGAPIDERVASLVGMAMPIRKTTGAFVVSFERRELMGKTLLRP